MKVVAFVIIPGVLLSALWGIWLLTCIWHLVLFLFQ